MDKGLRVRAVAAAVAVTASLWGVSAASAEVPEGVDFGTTMSPETASWEWTGSTTAGVNVTHFDAALGEQCGDTPDTECDRVLITVELPLNEGFLQRTATLTVGIGGYTVPVSDFDMFGYTSDETGVRGTRTGNSGNNPGDPESLTFSVRSTETKTTHHFLAEIPYFAAAGAYEGTAVLLNVKDAKPVPAPTA